MLCVVVRQLCVKVRNQRVRRCSACMLKHPVSRAADQNGVAGGRRWSPSRLTGRVDSASTQSLLICTLPVIYRLQTEPILQGRLRTVPTTTPKHPACRPGQPARALLQCPGRGIVLDSQCGAGEDALEEAPARCSSSPRAGGSTIQQRQVMEVCAKGPIQ